MLVYTMEERIDMIFVLRECLDNCLLASQVYATKFPNRTYSNKFDFKRLLSKLRQSGSVQYEKPTKHKRAKGKH